MPRLLLYRFRYRDPIDGKWVRARYVAEEREIARVTALSGKRSVALPTTLPHWHGKTALVGGPLVARRTDVLELLPGSIADVRADNPGEWLYHCHVADHIEAGMVTGPRRKPLTRN